MKFTFCSVYCMTFWFFFGQDSIKLVLVNQQWWSMTNLSVTTFRNGDPIKNAQTRQEWIDCLQSGTPAYCAYLNDPANAQKYGYIYNWFAIADLRGLAPNETRVAHNGDYSRLYIEVNKDVDNYPGHGFVGLRLKDSLDWEVGQGGEDQFDFSILPGGYRNENGDFMGKGRETALWVRDTATYGSHSLGDAYSSPYALIHGQKQDILFQTDGKRSGCYVRVVIGDEFLQENMPVQLAAPEEENNATEATISKDKKKKKKKS